MSDSAKVPPNLRAVVTIRYMVPKSMPPVFNQILPGTVFARADLPALDVAAMLRQGTLVETADAVGPPPAKVEPPVEPPAEPAAAAQPAPQPAPAPAPEPPAPAAAKASPKGQPASD